MASSGSGGSATCHSRGASEKAALAKELDGAGKLGNWRAGFPCRHEILPLLVAWALPVRELNRPRIPEHVPTYSM